MLLRLPKPLHGWRAFAGEVGVIVIGVLIALGASELIRQREERAQSRKAHANIRAEIGEALGRMQSRMAIQDCVDRRIGEISVALIAADRGQPVPAFSWVGRPQYWTLSDTRWETASNSGGTSLFDPDTQASYSFLYSGIRDFEHHEQQEQLAWAALRSLTEMRNLEAPQRAFLTQALQGARFAAFRMGVIFVQRVDRAKEMGIAPSPTQSIGSRSICVSRDTPRDIANRQSGPYREPD